MKIELRLPFCTCGREKKPVSRKRCAGAGPSPSVSRAVLRDRLRGRHIGRRQKQVPLAHAEIHQLLQHLAAEHLVDPLLHASPPE